MTITQLIEKAREGRASDIHLVCGLTPRCRVDGSIRELGGERLTPEQCLDYVRELAGEQYDAMVEVGEADLAKTIAGVRCRLNLFRQQGSWSAAIRLLNEHVPELSELGLPKVVREFPGYSQGLVLITGETGSGKSTTLAAVLNEINQTQSKHILTLEDRADLREDPDVILVGEMRDLETIETALTAAETGHLVFGTVHTNSAADSIDRMVDVFPAERQQQIRLQLSMTLKAVLSQQLLPQASGKGRVLACEVMKTDGAIRNLIREGKTPQIINSIQTTGSIGNILMERALLNLLNAGTISRETYEQALPGGSVQAKDMGMGGTLNQNQRRGLGL